jgi:hypothetical protein
VTQEITEQIDMAQVFVKIGGLTSLTNILHSDSVPLATLAAAAISTLAQNNPIVQEMMITDGLVQQLQTMIYNRDHPLFRARVCFHRKRTGSNSF